MFIENNCWKQYCGGEYASSCQYMMRLIKWHKSFGMSANDENKFTGILTCKIVGCCMWCPLTKVNASAWRGVTVHTLSCNDIKQWRGWIDGPNNCSGFVFADPTCVVIHTQN